MIRIINQITAPDSGEVFFGDEKITPRHTELIGYLPEERGLYKKMRVGEQAVYLARLKGMEKRDAESKLKDWFKKFEILTWWDKKVEELSKGMQQKVQFIVTVLHQPRLLILDEPFTGFDPINVELIKSELLRMRNEGTTIILSTHNMASVEELCNYITLINQAKTVLEGDVNKLRHRYKEHLWEVKLEGSEELVRASLNHKFELLDYKPFLNMSVAKIKIPENLTPNDLLKALLPICTIIGFCEILPSMGEIFISSVKRTNPVSYNS